MPNDAQSQPNASSGDPELERLKERLSFYESFDQLIQSNVSQAGNLLREAIDLRESAAADAESARQRIDEERTGDHERYRALFSVMLDEITSLQGQAERLARRLTDAIDQLELKLGPGADFPPLPSSLTSELGIEALPQPDEGAALDNQESDEGLDTQELEPPPEPAALQSGSDEDHEIHEVPAGSLLAAPEPTPEADLSETANPPPASDEEPPERRAQEAPGLDDTMIDVRSGSSSGVGGDAIDDSVEPSEAASSTGNPFILLVHGVPKAATALSLKRHLEMLEAVHRVEPREFAAGVLRLQLQVDRDITGDDLETWTLDSGFRTIHSRSGLLEIQLIA